MNGDGTYSISLGRFATGSKAIEVRAYFDNLTFRTGRSGTATSADMNFITNDQVVSGISANMNLMPRGNLNLCPTNGGTNTNGLALTLQAQGLPFMKSINTTNSNMALRWSSNGVHCRDAADTVFEPFYASAFNVSSHRKFKENIEEFKDNVLEKIKNTPVRKYRLKEAAADQEQIGLILDEAPEDLKSQDGETLQLYKTIGYLWKAVQELTAKIEGLEHGL
jgi:Chaperone of endosialidase